MGDLISRSALSKAICNKECEIPSFESVKELNIFLAGLNVKQIAVMECLGNAPTAYDVDKVVEQLERHTWHTEAHYDEDGFCCDDSEEVICLEDAVEIVKAGGVE